MVFLLFFTSAIATAALGIFEYTIIRMMVDQTSAQIPHWGMIALVVIFAALGLAAALATLGLGHAIVTDFIFYRLGGKKRHDERRKQEYISHGMSAEQAQARIEQDNDDFEYFEARHRARGGW